MDQKWFQPVARIGDIGNDEYVLEPVNAFKEYIYCTDPANSSREDCGGVERGDATGGQHCACRECLRQEPQTETDSVRAKIKKESATELLSCTPTPVARNQLIAEIRAKTTGELFIYVNDAILMLPGISDVFYSNNSGKGSITVTPLSDSGPMN